MVPINIINYNRKPNITLSQGSNADLNPIISNGQIVEVLVNADSGVEYTTPPNFNVVGFGAALNCNY